MSPSSPNRPIRERLTEFYRRLRLLPSCNTADLALQQICETLEQVEDECSGIAKRTPPPGPADFDGRMYCPYPDFVQRYDDGSILALTRGHRIEIAASGSVRIIGKLSNLLEFEK